MTFAAVPLKYVASLNDDKLSESTDPDLEFRYLDIGSVGRGSLAEEPESMTFGSAPSRARRLVAPGDTLISTVRTYLRAVWAVEGPTEDLVVSTGFAVVRPRKLNATFLRWAVQADTFIEEVVGRSTGVSYPAINPGDLAMVPVHVPPPAQQRRIAEFLDAETARIDALVAVKQRMIGTLAAARSAVVQHGVVGLDGGRQLRTSQVPWAPTIPCHWAEAKLTLMADLGSGHTPSRRRPEWWLDRTIPWITTGEVAQMRSDRIEEITETREKLSELGVANSSAVVHPAGTVVLCRTAASAGFSAIMGQDMAVSQDIATWRCGPQLRPRYLLLCLRAMRQDLLERLAMGSTHKTIYMPDLESIRIPIPPLAEQDEIVESVWRRLRRTDRITDTLTAQIELLRERRQALITAAVTGAIEV